MSDLKKTVFIFSSISVAIILLFQLKNWSLFALGGSENLHIIISSSLFLLLGVIISRYFYVKKTAKRKKLQKSVLSGQELKVLNNIAEGKSNKEIADELFIAETTVKSHVSNILIKLNAKRRTEAVRIGKEMGIL